MKNNDDFLSRQGSVYTLVDAEGYLVREDPKTNFRARYTLSGGGSGSYTAGSGLILDNNEFSVDFTEVAGKSDIISYTAGSGLVLDNGEFAVDFNEVAKPYTAGNGISLSGQEFSIDTSIVATKTDFTNKGKIKVGEEAITGTIELKYDPNYIVFKNEVTLSSNVLDIGKMDFTDFELNNNEEATFEMWLTFTNFDDALTIQIDEDINVVNSLPDALNGTYIHVFVRRVYKDNLGQIHEDINYAYSF